MIVISPRAVLDDNQRKILDGIGKYTDNDTIYVTRGHSLPIDQLRHIEQYAIIHNCKFSEFEHDNLFDKVDIWINGENKNIYRWQQSWSMLLHLYWMTKGLRGALINPPFAEECLFDYFNNGVNKKGQIINPSPHIKDLTCSRPCPIDFSQRINGQVVAGEMVGGKADIDRVAKIMDNARAGGVGIQDTVIERSNGCVHIDTTIV